MTGYRKNEKANKEAFHYIDNVPYFRTGDLGHMVEGKFLKVTGRIKEQFKLDNGKFVVPGVLEDTINRSAFIAQSFMYGDNQKFSSALIVPELSEVRKWADNLNLQYSNNDDELMMLDEVRGLISSEILKQSSGMKSYEKPIKWCYTTTAFSQENHLLTAKMSMRRANILKAYGDLLLGLYTPMSMTDQANDSNNILIRSKESEFLQQD